MSASMLAMPDAVALLASPDTHAPLALCDDRLVPADGGRPYPLREGLPFLFPSALQPYLGADTLELPLDFSGDALLQYALLTSVRHRQGFPNSPYDSSHYQGHLESVERLVSGAKGTVLDIGCDSPAVSSQAFPSTTQYLGLDPLYYDKHQFRLIAMAEFLPVADSCFDNVCLLSSL